MGTITSNIGLISGINTGQIIDQLMSIESQPVAVLTNKISSTTAQQQAQAQAADAARDLDTYRQLLRINNDQMAVSMGHDIISHYPDSAAAKEVQRYRQALMLGFRQLTQKNLIEGAHCRIEDAQGIRELN